MRLSRNDYISILKYYKVDFSNMKIKTIKTTAEDILANKLCRCIKKVDKKNNNETKAIAICKNSIFTKKNLRPSRFKCKGSAKLLPNSKNGRTLSKRSR